MGVELWGKSYGIKPRCYCEHLGVHIGNMMGTHWEQGKELKVLKSSFLLSFSFVRF
jgi:hypothetical protein